MADETGEGSKLVKEESETDKQIYHDSGASPTTRIIQKVSLGVVILMVLVTMGLSIYRTVAVDGLYILLGINVLALAQIGLVVFYWIYKEDIPANKSWFLYVVDVAVILECIFTNILLFRQ